MIYEDLFNQLKFTKCLVNLTPVFIWVLVQYMNVNIVFQSYMAKYFEINKY